MTKGGGGASGGAGQGILHSGSDKAQPEAGTEACKCVEQVNLIQLKP